VAFLAVGETPVVAAPAPLSHHDIARARTILQQGDPRGLAPGDRRTVRLTAQDLDLALNYLLQKLGHGRARVALGNDRLTLHATVELPGLRSRRFLNLTTVIETRGGQAVIAGLRVGSVPVPGALATTAARWWLTRTLGRDRIDSAHDLVRNLEVAPDELRLSYRWNPAMIEQARDTLLGGQSREALGFYLDRLVELQARGIGVQGSLAPLLGPLFASAQTRSRDHDPVSENAALLTVLGTWAGRQNVNRLVPQSRHRPQGFRLKLEGRVDFAQHFLISAALAARGDSTLSDAVGLFKEIADTDRGSGFSFTDIAADRTGTRFGEIATRSEASARELQRQVAKGIAESAIMPAARDLPEHLDTATFRRRYGEVGSPAYQAVIDDIDRRIGALALYGN